IQEREDYTGITISLLGPDAPRDIDKILAGVLKARTAEVLIRPGERQKIAEIIQQLRTNEDYCRGITGTGLDYSQQLFLKYDYSLPEDETKKFIETVNLMYLLGDKKLVSTLDIGSATGRYPTLMTWLGAKARGIDIEPNAINYAKERIPANEEWPKYDVADARNLPFENGQFDLVTCMMGTFSHIPKKDQSSVIESIYGTLKEQGCIAISTWDLECAHLTYLSIYNEKQKDMIRANSPSVDEIESILTSAGFIEVVVHPFCLLPQVVVYDLGIEKLRAGDIQLIAQADIAVRSLYPRKHGEMYLAFGVKP
ncbi:methyltransferase domain-containing protein, partial [Candidatus Pacearchaeota archaeon]|nr:methyltransferase domain-containing protein [Candidatus Pacearchaeota archaeon]